jgi:hypothetical protein
MMGCELSRLQAPKGSVPGPAARVAIPVETIKLAHASLINASGFRCMEGTPWVDGRNSGARFTRRMALAAE